MKKTKKTVRLGALLLIVCLVSTVMLSGTFAKYTSEYAGQDTALVARWSFTGNFDDVALSGTNIPLPIWDHEYTTNIFEKDGTDYLIAPGIQGSFKIDFAYNADVDANLIFNFTKSGIGAAKVPVQYSLDSNFATKYYSLNDLEDAIIDIASTTSGSNITGEDGTYVVTDTSSNDSPITVNTTIYWKWPYNVSEHGNAAALLTGGFTGSGDGGAWTDADDVIAGNSSKLANRDSYVLNLQIQATQITPGTVAAPALTSVAIGDTAKVGEQLTPVKTGGTATSYEWFNSSSLAGPWLSITTANTYTPAASDLGKYIKVIATGAGTVTSAFTSPVTSAITGIAAITGDTQVGEELTAGALTPADATVSYQWQVCDSAAGTYVNIGGANESTYTLPAAYQGKYIKVVAIGKGNYSGTATSDATGAVAAAD